MGLWCCAWGSGVGQWGGGVAQWGVTHGGILHPHCGYISLVLYKNDLRSYNRRMSQVGQGTSNCFAGKAKQSRKYERLTFSPL